MISKQKKEPTRAVLLVLPVTLWDLIDRYAAKKELDRTKYIHEVLTTRVLQEREDEERAADKEKEARKKFRDG